MNQMQRKKKLKGFVWNFKGAGARFKEEEEEEEKKKKKKKRNGPRRQTRGVFGAHTISHCAGSVKTFQMLSL